MTTGGGINILGYASSNIGLGAVAREFARALVDNGYAVAIFDIDPGGGRQSFDMSLHQMFVPTIEDLPHDVNIWVLGGVGIEQAAFMVCGSEQLQRSFNVAFWWWELPDIPPVWREAAQVFDALLTGSEFIREAVASQVPNVPVLLAQHPINIPDGVLPDRGPLGLKDEDFVVYTGFEPASDPARKNPFATIAAFQQAFQGGSHARLVIKLNNGSGAGGVAELQLARLHGIVAKDNRILLINDRLQYADLLRLYASCDVAVSLHRSEGLGLMPLEAMRLGKPVIATGWSGNMTYMNHCNAALVRYGFVATDESSLHYSPSAIGITSRWADPDAGHAASWLGLLAEDDALRETMGRRARNDSLAYDRVARRTLFAEELAELRRRQEMIAPKDFASIAKLITERQADENRRATKARAPSLGVRFRSALQTRFERYVTSRSRRNI